MAVATIHTEFSLPRDFTVANGTTIAKGTICQMTDPLTALAISASGQVVAGIASQDKIASDGRDKLGFWRDGWFKVTASGSITVGDGLLAGVDNIVSTSSVAGAATIGIALETAADTETFIMELQPTGDVQV